MQNDKKVLFHGLLTLKVFISSKSLPGSPGIWRSEFCTCPELPQTEYLRIHCLSHNLWLLKGGTAPFKWKKIKQWWRCTEPRFFCCKITSGVHSHALSSSPAQPPSTSSCTWWHFASTEGLQSALCTPACSQGAAEKPMSNAVMSNSIPSSSVTLMMSNDNCYRGHEVGKANSNVFLVSSSLQ